MRGSLSDFYTLERVAPVSVSVLPADFDPSYIDYYADKPLAPEIAECERCNPARCHALIRTSGNTLKPDCAAFLALDAPPAPRKAAVKMTPPQIRACILGAMRGGKVLSLYEIMDATGLLYGTARNYVTALLNEGRIAGAGWRNTGLNTSRGQQRLYCLPEYKPASVDDRKPRAPRTVNHEKELCKANNARLLAVMRERGPSDASKLAELIGLSSSITRKKLLAFERQGVVRRCGEITVTCGKNTPRQARLWEIVTQGEEI